MSKTKPLLKRWTGPMLCLVSIVILTMPLSGCDEVTFRFACPQLKTYSKAFQDVAAAEVAKSSPAVKQLVSDYGQLRDACRAMERVK